MSNLPSLPLDELPLVESLEEFTDQVKALSPRKRRDLKLKTILQSILNVPTSKLPWDELKHLVPEAQEVRVEDAMHLAMVREAINGNTKAYEMLTDRVHGKMANINVSAKASDYKSFLDEAAGENTTKEGDEPIDVTPHSSHQDLEDDEYPEELR